MSFLIQKVHDFAVELAKKAGLVMKKAHNEKKTIQLKSSPADLLTETDLECEKLVRDAVADTYPTHKFIGEESTFSGEKCSLTDDPTWIVDPVDGTCNFVHRFPHFCISIGITYKKEPVIGVIYNPILDELYTAMEGNGAFLNGQPIKVTDTKELTKALVISEFGSGKVMEELAVKVANVGTLIKQAHGIRCLGSAALNISSIASGRSDAYIEYGLHCWDMAAGVVLIQEAGGVVMDPTGCEFNIMNRRLLCAGTRELCDDIRPHLQHLTLASD